MKKSSIAYTGKFPLAGIIIILFFSSCSLYSFAQNDALRMRITSLNNNYSDETVIRFLNGATTEYDPSYDAWKMFSPNQNVPAFYTMLNGSSLSINAYPDLDQDRQFDLHYRANATADYLIEMEEALPFTMPVSFLMLDKQTGITYTQNDFPVTINLPAYSDTIARFAVIFSLPASISEENTSCFNTADGMVTVNKPGNHNFSYLIEDENGQTIKNNSQVDETWIITDLQAGNYTLVLNAYGINEFYPVHITEPDQVIADFTKMENSGDSGSGLAVDFTNLSSGASSFYWDFGDGNSSSAIDPLHSYVDNGNYPVILTAYDSSGNCYSSHSDTIKVDLETEEMNVGISNFNHEKNASLRWNGADQTITVNPGFIMNRVAKVMIYDLSGRLVLVEQHMTYENDTVQILITKPLTGIYVLRIENEQRNYTNKIYLQ